MIVGCSSGAPSERAAVRAALGRGAPGARARPGAEGAAGDRQDRPARGRRARRPRGSGCCGPAALESESGLAFAGLVGPAAAGARVPAGRAGRAAGRAARRARAGAAGRPRPLRRLRGHPQPDRRGGVRLAGADRRRRRPLARRPDPRGAGVLRPPHRGRAGRDPRRLARGAAPERRRRCRAWTSWPSGRSRRRGRGSCSRSATARPRRSPRPSRARSSRPPRATRSPSSSCPGR